MDPRGSKVALERPAAHEADGFFQAKAAAFFSLKAFSYFMLAQVVESSTSTARSNHHRSSRGERETIILGRGYFWAWNTQLIRLLPGMTSSICSSGWSSRKMAQHLYSGKTNFLNILRLTSKCTQRIISSRTRNRADLSWPSAGPRYVHLTGEGTPPQKTSGRFEYRFGIKRLPRHGLAWLRLFEQPS